MCGLELGFHKKYFKLLFCNKFRCALSRLLDYTLAPNLEVKFEDGAKVYFSLHVVVLISAPYGLVPLQSRNFKLHRAVEKKAAERKLRSVMPPIF